MGLDHGVINVTLWHRCGELCERGVFEVQLGLIAEGRESKAGSVLWIVNQRHHGDLPNKKHYLGDTFLVFESGGQKKSGSCCSADRSQVGIRQAITMARSTGYPTYY
jgi:hypothetical protein